MTNKKTLRELLLPGKTHNDTEESQKINYAMKTIIRIIIFYLVESVILIKIRDYHFIRNLNHMDLHRPPLPPHVISDLRNIRIIENMLITITMTIISLAILYYCNDRMTKGQP